MRYGLIAGTQLFSDLLRFVGKPAVVGVMALLSLTCDAGTVTLDFNDLNAPAVSRNVEYGGFRFSACGALWQEGYPSGDGHLVFVGVFGLNPNYLGAFYGKTCYEYNNSGNGPNMGENSVLIDRNGRPFTLASVYRVDTAGYCVQRVVSSKGGNRLLDEKCSLGDPDTDYEPRWKYSFSGPEWQDVLWIRFTSEDDYPYGGVAIDDLELINPDALPMTLSLKSSEIAGCKSTVGTITLANPAPATGAVVTLTDNLTSATTPASVSFLPGQSTKTFSVFSSEVAGQQRGNITATFGGLPSAQFLTLRPQGLASIALSPSTAIGGTTVNGTASLDCVSKLAPIAVDLTSSNTLIASPLASSISTPAAPSYPKRATSAARNARPSGSRSLGTSMTSIVPTTMPVLAVHFCREHPETRNPALSRVPLSHRAPDAQAALRRPLRPSPARPRPSSASVPP